MQTKFYKEDFEKYFMVDYLENSIIDPDIAEILEKHNIQNDPQASADHIPKYLELYGPYLERGFEKDRRLYVSLVSPEVGYGTFAEVYISAESVIGEYTGIITNKFANTDYAWVYYSSPEDKGGNELSLRINARVAGNMMRFINHSDNPNCYFVHLPFKNRWRTVYVALRSIMPNEELTVNYGPNYWKFRENKG